MTSDAGGVPAPRALQISRTLPAAPEQVWAALTDPQALAAWFWPADHETTVEADARVGGRYRIAAAGRDRAVGGEYLEVAAPRRLVTTWQWEGDDVSTVVRVDVLGNEHGSGLVLTHEGLPPGDVEPHEQGWVTSLDRLEEHLR